MTLPGWGGLHQQNGHTLRLRACFLSFSENRFQPQRRGSFVSYSPPQSTVAPSLQMAVELFRAAGVTRCWLGMPDLVSHRRLCLVLPGELHAGTLMAQTVVHQLHSSNSPHLFIPFHCPFPHHFFFKYAVSSRHSLLPPLISPVSHTM